MKNIFEDMGKIVAETIGKKGLEMIRRRIETFDVNIAGVDNLLKLKDRPYILAANHIKPANAKAEQSQLSPDAFILESIVKEQTDKELKIIAKYGDGWWAENLYRYFQKYVSLPFSKGMMKGMDFVPINKNPGSINKDFLKAIEKVMTDKNPLLIFPEGHWYEDFDPGHKLDNGAAHIALKYNLPIISAYIHGGRNWKEGEKVEVSFGQHFDPTGFSKEEITEKIREQITELQGQVKKSRNAGINPLT